MGQEIKLKVKSVNDKPYVKDGLLGKKVLEEGKVGVYSLDVFDDVDGEEVVVEVEELPSFVEENRSSKELVAKPALGTKGIYKIKLLGSDGKLNTTAEMELEVLESNKGEDNMTFIIGGSAGGGAVVIVGIVAGIVIRKRSIWTSNHSGNGKCGRYGDK